MASHIIVKSHNVDNDIELRIVADDRPHTLAHNITPDLDDLFYIILKKVIPYETIDSI